MQRHITEFLGPIFAKEIIEIARRWRYYMCRGLYGAILVFLLYVAWEQSSALSMAMGTRNTLARLAGEIFIATSYLQLWSVYLLVPAFLCGVIAGEREEQTLDLLFITPLTDREIVLGKLFSRVAAMICLILCGVPVVSLLMMFGGISPESIWRVLAATLLAILFTGSHAIYFSAIARGPMEALARTYIAFFMWLAGLAILAWGFQEMLQAVGNEMTAELAQRLAPAYLIYPLVSFWGAVNESYHTTLGFLYGSWGWPASFAFPALWSVFLLWRAARRLRQTPAPGGSWMRSLSWLGRRRNALPNPKRADARRARAGRLWFGHVVANPLWLRSRLTHVYDRVGSLKRLQWLGWIIVVFAIVMLAAFNPSGLSHEGYSIAFQLPTWGTIGLVTALVCGHSLIGDRRRGFLEQVIVTPLSSREIVDGAALALWEHLRNLLWLPWALGAFFWFTGASSPAGLLLSLITATLFGAVLAWQGLACSLAARTTAGAVVSSFVLPATAIFLMPMTMVSFRQNNGVALWIIIGIWFAVTWCWSRTRLNAASTGCYLTALHLALVALAECWTYGGRDNQYPMAAMHPGFLIARPLIDPMVPRSYDDVWSHHPWGISLCYWAALALNMALIRWWLVRHFDRLVDRAESTGRRTGSWQRDGAHQSASLRTLDHVP
ncbi:MAG: ABC transporter permease [Gemmataceae bacterium]|nr:ABC transporter permease [Gemmataceae bacterium]